MAEFIKKSVVFSSDKLRKIYDNVNSCTVIVNLGSGNIATVGVACVIYFAFLLLQRLLHDSDRYIIILEWLVSLKHLP